MHHYAVSPKKKKKKREALVVAWVGGISISKVKPQCPERKSCLGHSSKKVSCFCLKVNLIKLKKG